MLDGFDADRVIVDVQGAGCFAGSRANSAGEFGEVIGGVQGIKGCAIITAVNQIIPVRDNIVNGATCRAEGCTAVHAARTFKLDLVILQGNDKLFIIFYPFNYRQVRFVLPFEFHKTGYFTHYLPRYNSPRLWAVNIS